MERSHDVSIKDNKFSCGVKNCKGTLLPIKIINYKESDELMITGKCMSCEKVYTFKASSLAAGRAPRPGFAAWTTRGCRWLRAVARAHRDLLVMT